MALILKKILIISLFSYSYLFKLAQNFEKQNKLEQALQIYSFLISQKPFSEEGLEALKRKAIIETKLGKYEQAQQTFSLIFQIGNDTIINEIYPYYLMSIKDSIRRLEEIYKFLLKNPENKKRRLLLNAGINYAKKVQDYKKLLYFLKNLDSDYRIEKDKEIADAYLKEKYYANACPLLYRQKRWDKIAQVFLDIGDTIKAIKFFYKAKKISQIEKIKKIWKNESVLDDSVKIYVNKGGFRKVIGYVKRKGFKNEKTLEFVIDFLIKKKKYIEAFAFYSMSENKNPEIEYKILVGLFKKYGIILKPLSKLYKEDFFKYKFYTTKDSTYLDSLNFYQNFKLPSDIEGLDTLNFGFSKLEKERIFKLLDLLIKEKNYKKVEKISQKGYIKFKDKKFLYYIAKVKNSRGEYLKAYKMYLKSGVKDNIFEAEILYNLGLYEFALDVCPRSAFDLRWKILYKLGRCENIKEPDDTILYVYAVRKKILKGYKIFKKGGVYSKFFAIGRFLAKLERSGLSKREAEGIINKLEGIWRGWGGYLAGINFGKKKMFQIAREYFLKGIQWGDKEIRGLSAFKLAGFYFADEKYKDAIDYYKIAYELLEDEKFRKISLLNIATSYKMLKIYDKAEEYYRRYIKEFWWDSGVKDAEFSLAYMWHMIGEYAKARMLYSSLLGEMPTAFSEAELKFWYAECLAASNMFEEALHQYKMIVQNYSGVGEWGVTAKLKMGKVLSILKRYDEALKVFKSIIRSRGPDDAFSKAAKAEIDLIKKTLGRENGKGR